LPGWSALPDRVGGVLFGITPADSGAIILGGKRLQIGSPRKLSMRASVTCPKTPAARSYPRDVRRGEYHDGHPSCSSQMLLRFGSERALTKISSETGYQTPSPETPRGIFCGNQQKSPSPAGSPQAEGTHPGRPTQEWMLARRSKFIASSAVSPHRAWPC